MNLNELIAAIKSASPDDLKEINKVFMPAKISPRLSTLDISQEAWARMTKKQREEATWTLPELSDGLYNLLCDQSLAFKTGSSVYSNAEPKDEDWVIHIPSYVFSGFVMGMPAHDYWDDFEVLYAHKNGKLLNIMCVDYKTFNTWRATTDYMRQIRGLSVFGGLAIKIDTKWARVRLFRAIKDIMTTRDIKQSRLYLTYALDHSLCVCCHQEAINFISREHKELYLATGICDACEAEGVTRT